MIMKCDIFKILRYGPERDYPTGNYLVYEDFFINFNPKKEKKKIIDTISDELISKIWSPENIYKWISNDSCVNVNLSNFKDYLYIMKINKEYLIIVGFNNN